MGFLDFLIDIFTPAANVIICCHPPISILDYWNDIVDWASKSIINNKCIIFLRWVNGELIPEVLVLINGNHYVQPGKRIIATKEDLYKMCEAGIITEAKLEALLRGEKILTVINPK